MGFILQHEELKNYLKERNLLFGSDKIVYAQLPAENYAWLSITTKSIVILQVDMFGRLVKEGELVLNAEQTAFRFMENTFASYNFIAKENEKNEEFFIFKISKRILGNKQHKRDLEDLKQLYIKK
ncbi:MULTISPECIES: hypothetical protein [Enterococcus]|uniref:YokE-like PH domain-containing protein n=1 Tax=Enterococcus malodoratus ATCC 43197 TaxID=1158601 RepID=R2QMH9_9ENTE|nr:MULTISPECIES: hypothetical protein [Enterococcus]EOH72835.1 hypothetical protein UAI_03719 [Enterococcus malodoratus ATCC 43197]EOT67383.1 hypothetical protein I585_02904 [Enterococcus malodoratus ATCC 43197]OJG59220.1 hypothetical protein RV07_GL002698 [Enterococcus malodoratus]SPX03159.1 Uncharacterised protein [Enterococcus malodoratus]STD69365.1 Uncharacterised protein [Enterococcus malodoratus]